VNWIFSEDGKKMYWLQDELLHQEKHPYSFEENTYLFLDFQKEKRNSKERRALYAFLGTCSD